MIVKIFYKSNFDAHIKQIVTGYIMLEKLFDSLEIICNDDLSYPNNACIYVYLGDNIKIIYDMHDGYSQDINFSSQDFDKIDLYYKRSVNRNLTIEKMPEQLREKVKVLPFNYDVTHKKNPLNRESFICSSKVSFKIKDIKSKLLETIKVIVKGKDSYFDSEVFESSIVVNNKPKIMF